MVNRLIGLQIFIRRCSSGSFISFKLTAKSLWQRTDSELVNNSLLRCVCRAREVKNPLYSRVLFADIFDRYVIFSSAMKDENADKSWLF